MRPWRNRFEHLHGEIMRTGCPYRKPKPKQLTDARESVDSPIDERSLQIDLVRLDRPTPKAPPSAFDARAAAVGEKLFAAKARCASCHVPPLFTEPGWNLHKAEDIGIDDFQAKRAPDDRYRTAPLRALWDTKQIHKGGFYHDGRFAALNDVVDHYNDHFALDLTQQEKRDLIEYLNSL